jgi:hypothetical protein
VRLALLLLLLLLLLPVDELDGRQTSGRAASVQAALLIL